MVTLTDWQFVQMRFEASEYRRLLTVCREQIARQAARAESAEKTADALAAALRDMVDAFDPQTYGKSAAQAEKAQTAKRAHRQARELIERIRSEAR